MVFLVDGDTRRQFEHGLEQMHQTRREVFVDRLGWALEVDGAGREIDEFDTPDAEYLLDVEPATGRLLGSVRLLRTDRPHLLSEYFADLCEGPPPRGVLVREISRLVTATDLPRERSMRVRHRIASALMEYGLFLGLESYSLVTHMSWLPTLLCVGWTCHPLGLPQMRDGQSVGALSIEVSQAGLATLRGFGGRYPVLQLEPAPAPVCAEEGAHRGL